MNAAEITDKLGLHSLRQRNWYGKMGGRTSSSGLGDFAGRSVRESKLELQGADPQRQAGRFHKRNAIAYGPEPPHTNPNHPAGGCVAAWTQECAAGLCPDSRMQSRMRLMRTAGLTLSRMQQSCNRALHHAPLMPQPEHEAQATCLSLRMCG
eukprot:355371-Chlamydomonas_euryale.AAC.5